MMTRDLEISSVSTSPRGRFIGKTRSAGSFEGADLTHAVSPACSSGKSSRNFRKMQQKPLAHPSEIVYPLGAFPSAVSQKREAPRCLLKQCFAKRRVQRCLTENCRALHPIAHSSPEPELV